MQIRSNVATSSAVKLSGVSAAAQMSEFVPFGQPFYLRSANKDKQWWVRTENGEQAAGAPLIFGKGPRGHMQLVAEDAGSDQFLLRTAHNDSLFVSAGDSFENPSSASAEDDLENSSRLVLVNSSRAMKFGIEEADDGRFFLKHVGDLVESYVSAEGGEAHKNAYLLLGSQSIQFMTVEVNSSTNATDDNSSAVCGSCQHCEPIPGNGNESLLASLCPLCSYGMLMSWPCNETGQCQCREEPVEVLPGGVVPAKGQPEELPGSAVPAKGQPCPVREVVPVHKNPTDEGEEVTAEETTAQEVTAEEHGWVPAEPGQIILPMPD